MQTDFPSTLIEDYVVNNRKRILKLLGFTNATANLKEVGGGGLAAAAGKKLSHGLAGSTSLQMQSDRPQTLLLHSSWNPLPKGTTPPNSLKVEDEMTNHRPRAPAASASKKQHPKRNLYVGQTTHSMDCPTISVEKCSDSESPPGSRPKYSGAKRHSSTGDALELYRGNLAIQKRLRDLEANHSSSASLEAPSTDF